MLCRYCLNSLLFSGIAKVYDLVYTLFLKIKTVTATLAHSCFFNEEMLSFFVCLIVKFYPLNVTDFVFIFSFTLIQFLL